MPWTLVDQMPSLAVTIISIFVLQKVLSAIFRNGDHAKVWAKLDTVGVSGGIFSWTRAVAGSIISIPQNTAAGYEKFCKGQDRPFALPNIWVGGAVVVLPPSLLSLLNRPRTELSGFDALLDTVQLPYMIADRDIWQNVIHFEVVKKKLTRMDIISSIASVTAEELDVAFRASWGTSKEWKTINGWDQCGRIITRAGMRVLVGSTLCRNETLLEESRLYANSLFAGTGIINCLPPFVRPLMGPILALRAKYYQRRCKKILVPFIAERIRLFRESKEGDDQPNDLLQWLIATCAGPGNGPEQMDPTKIAGRLLGLNTMVLFGMAYVFAYCVLDLYGSPSKKEFISNLEEECERVSKEHGGLSSKAAVDSLYRIDSTIRESMRISDVGVTTLPLEVVKGTFDIGNGIKIPEGVRMVFPTQPMHLDPDYYEEPLRFDALRFSRKFEEDLNKTDEENGERELLTLPTKSFLAFGYGRHGCPGRWFAAQTIKQALSYVVSNYEVELTGQSIKRKALLNMMVPPTDAQIKIRRKAWGKWN